MSRGTLKLRMIVAGIYVSTAKGIEGRFTIMQVQPEGRRKYGRVWYLTDIARPRVRECRTKGEAVIRAEEILAAEAAPIKRPRRKPRLALLSA